MATKNNGSNAQKMYIHHLVTLKRVVAVPPPFLPLLEEYERLFFAGKVSVRVAGPSVLS